MYDSEELSFKGIDSHGEKRTQMKVTQAFLLTEYTEDEKKRLQLLGAFYSMTHKGWFVTSEQKEKFDKSATDTSILPTPIITSTKGVGIFVDDLVTEWKVYGETFHVKDKVKSLSARWNPSDKSWRIPRERASTREEIKAFLA